MPERARIRHRGAGETIVRMCRNPRHPPLVTPGYVTGTAADRPPASSSQHLHFLHLSRPATPLAPQTIARRPHRRSISTSSTCHHAHPPRCHRPARRCVPFGLLHFIHLSRGAAVGPHGRSVSLPSSPPLPHRRGDEYTGRKPVVRRGAEGAGGERAQQDL